MDIFHFLDRVLLLFSGLINQQLKNRQVHGGYTMIRGSPTNIKQLDTLNFVSFNSTRRHRPVV